MAFYFVSKCSNVARAELKNYNCEKKTETALYY